MKVRKLRLRGFLTYRDEVEIDFTRLFDKKIFLISGPTGSGKTTIFDAIAFALYGEVPREIAMENLRSDFLKETDPFTYVDLEFQIADRVYKVVRVPNQRAVEIKNPKNISHRVELYGVNEEKILLADKIKDADEKIKEIIGLDKMQFSKVMLLAQGQFQKFLISKSDEKAALLSDIFKTQPIKNIQDELKERAKDSKKKIGTLDKNLENIISFNEILEENISYDKIISKDFGGILGGVSDLEKEEENNLKILMNKLESLEDKEKTLIKDLEQARTKNENIEKYQESNKAYQELLKDLDTNTKIKSDLDLVSYALGIKIYEERYKKTASDLENFKKNKLSLEKNLRDKKNIQKDLEKDIKNLPNLKKKLDSLKISHSKNLKKIGDLEEFLKVKASFEAVKDLDKDIEKLEKEIKKDNEDLEKLRSTYDEKSKTLANLKEEGFSYREKITTIKARLDKLKDEYNTLVENESYRSDLENFSKRLALLEEEKKKADQDKDKLEINKLIDKLNKEGVCPVCGKDHEGDRKKLPTGSFDLEKISEDLADLRISLEKTKAIYEKNIKDLNKDYKIKDLEEIIGENENLLKSYKELFKKSKAQVKKITKSLTDIGNKGMIIKKSKEDKENTLANLSLRLKDLENLRAKYLAGKETMEGLDKNILKKEKENLEKEIADLESFIGKKEKSYQDLKLEISNLKSRLEALKENIKKMSEDKKSYQKDFNEKLFEKFKDEGCYRAYLEMEEDLKDRKDLIDLYFKNLEREKTIRDNLSSFKDEKVLDLDDFRDKIEKINGEIKEIDSRKMTASSRLDSIRKDKEKILGVSEDFKKLEDKAKITSYLSDLANGVTGGVKGVERLDFETFILSVYFDKVLTFANIRFNQMTDGQFSMVRKTEGGDARSKMGLDIEILDSNTGKKRPAATLSGGENFLASLSLALGLSDEIGAENGGIRIGTLFIDEGFGTLSKDFLANAIEAIEKLSKEDRFVGLISHVDELKDAVEAQIVISYDPSQGSSLEIVND